MPRCQPASREHEVHVHTDRIAGEQRDASSCWPERLCDPLATLDNYYSSALTRVLGCACVRMCVWGGGEAVFVCI